MAQQRVSTRRRHRASDVAVLVLLYYYYPLLVFGKLLSERIAKGASLISRFMTGIFHDVIIL